MTDEAQLTEELSQELGEQRSDISIAEFFEKNKHMLGFDSQSRALITSVKEAVDNALDACEEARIEKPHITIIIEKNDNGWYEVTVRDNGPGIARDEMENVFGSLLYGSRFHARQQTRGQQGIGISATVLYAQHTTGENAEVISKTPDGEVEYMELGIDTDTNEPEIYEHETGNHDFPHEHGTEITVTIEANMRSRSQLHKYIRNTAIVNPYARVEFSEPKEEMVFEADEGAELPDETQEILPHIHGVELGTLKKILETTNSHKLKSCLKTDFTRVGEKTAQSAVDNFIDFEYGRYFEWDIPTDKEVKERMRDELGENLRKKDEDLDVYWDNIQDYLESYDKIGYEEFQLLIDDVADETKEETGTSFGETSRERTVNTLWNILVDESPTPNSLYEKFDDATSKRKDDEVVSKLAVEMAEEFSGYRSKPLPRERVQEIIDGVSSTVTDETNTSIGDTAREKLFDIVWSRMSTTQTVDVPSPETITNTNGMARKLHKALQLTDAMSPPTDCLSPIGEEMVEGGLRKEYDAEFFSSVTRDADVANGEPFVVEAGIAYGGNLDSGSGSELLRVANRVPLVYQRGGCLTTKAVRGIDWRHYFKSNDLDQTGGEGNRITGPIVIMVHVASTNVPFTSESKDAISEVPEIRNEIENAVRATARDLKDYLSKQEKKEKRREKKKEMDSILEGVAEITGDVLDVEEPPITQSLAEVMNSVLVSRTVDEDGTVTLSIQNKLGKTKSLSVTNRVSREPSNVDDGLVVEEDGDEWVLKWDGEVTSEESLSFTYDWTTDGRAGTSLDVSDIEDAYVTVYQGDN